MRDCTQSLPTLGDEDKSMRVWLPKADNELSVRGKIPHIHDNDKCHLSISCWSSRFGAKLCSLLYVVTNGHLSLFCTTASLDIQFL